MTTYSWSSLVNGQTVVFNPNQDLLDFGTIYAPEVNISVLTASSTQFSVAGKSVTLNGLAMHQIVTRELFSSDFQNVKTSGFGRLLVGDNLLATGDDVANSLTGGSWEDQLIGLGGNDTLSGSYGKDLLNGGAGDDVLNGGADIDTVTYASATAGVSVSFLVTAPQDTVGAGTDTLSNLENLTGSPFADNLTGDNGNNVITGGAGNDTMDGAAGSDTVFYGNATTAVIVNLGAGSATGGDGQDTLANFENVSGSAYADLLTGSDSANLLEGQAGNDTLVGGPGNDTLVGGIGDDSLSGGDGNDQLTTGLGNDQLDGGSGIDTASFAAATAGVSVDLQGETASGQGWTDNVVNVEYLIGTSNNDTLLGSNGDNNLSGSSGDDLLSGLAGNDTLDGGTGTDTADYSAASTGVTVNLALSGAQATGGAGNDTLISIERLLGSSFDDTLSGSSANDILDGGAGNDVIDGGTGLDAVSYISATSGITLSLSTAGPQNTLGAGVDTLISIESLEGTSFGDTLTGDNNGNELSGYLGNDMLQGMAGNDTLRGWEGNDTLEGGSGDDSLYGGEGNDLFQGGDGIDTVSYALATSAVTVNLGLATQQDTKSEGFDTFFGIEALTGSSYGDTLLGGTGNDYLYGGAGSGHDSLDGGGGNDTLSGGLSADTLIGGSGNDSLTGGGVDYYWTGSQYQPYWGTDGDRMLGGSGDDSYVVTVSRMGTTGTQQYYSTYSSTSLVTISSLYAPDLVVELANEGRDKVQSYVSYILPENVEDLELLTSFSINATGNDLENSLKGNSESNSISGLGGGDIIDGGAGNDTLSGGAGYDTFQFSANNNGIDTITDWTVGDRITVLGTTLSQPTSGNGTALQLGQVQVTSELGVTTVFVGTDNIAGWDVQIKLNGLFTADQFQVIGSSLSFGSPAPANHAPSGSDITVAVFEDTAYTFSAANFGFSDASDNPANVLLAVRISSLPAAGSLTLSGNPVSAGQSISVADIAAGYLVFTPTAGTGGAAYASFTFQVQDDGGTAIGGVDLDPTPNQVTIDVVGKWLIGGGDNDSLVGGLRDDFLQGQGGNDTLQGVAGNDTLLGGAGNDVLDGGTGADSLNGGDGNDYYFVDNSGDLIVDANAGTAGGNDVVYSLLGAYTLATNVETGRILATGAANLSGNDLANLLFAGLGDNILDGGSGVDTVTWQYGVSGSTGVSANLTTGLASGSGSDTLIGIENLTGSVNADSLTGDGNANILDGAAGSDNLNGAGGNDTMIGGAGVDVLDGGSGADSMSGGDGNDYYFVDNAGDQVVESNASMAGGNDVVYSALAAYTLGANVEIGRIVASGAASLTGNTLANLLYTGSGNGTLNGAAGNDNLLGGSAVDVLDGGSGADSMSGGDGNDYYFVDNVGDQVIESNAGVAGGNDVVYSALAAYTLGANVEIGRIVASGAASLTGNGLANILYAGAGSATLNGAAGNDNLIGGSGVDVLDGGSGADSMSGGDGNDYYFIDNVGDQVVESNAGVAGGNDVVYSALAAYTLGANVEIGRIVTGGGASLTGNGLANVLYAGSGDNVLDGGAGNDTLAGGLGNDLLIGGSGADTFRFDTAPNGTSNLETIGDFSVVDDTIVLENAVFTSLLASGPLAAGAFRAGAGASSAADADDYLIYDTTTGALYYDAAGNTGDAPVQIALLGSGLALTALDFVVI